MTVQDLIDAGLPLDAPITVVRGRDEEGVPTYVGEVVLECDLPLVDTDGRSYVVLRHAPAPGTPAFPLIRLED